MSAREFFYIDQKVAESYFREILEEKNIYRILNIYGPLGSGKTTFLNYLESKYLQNNRNYAYIKIDFANRLMHNPKYAIMHIAKELESRYGYDFISLWKAYAILWQKRYDNSLIMYANDLPYIHEIKKLLNIDKKGKSFIKIIKGLFKDSIYKELEALKELESFEIEKRLFFFFAEDFKNMLKIKGFKDSIFLIDNHNLLDEKVYESPCKKDAWIRELVHYLGKNALFVIASKEPIAWYKCNIALKSGIKEYEFKPFSAYDAKRYLSYFGIEDEKLQEALLVITHKEAFLLSLAKEAYTHNKKAIPVVKEELYESFFNTFSKDTLKLLEVFSFARVASKELLLAIIKKFDLQLSEKELDILLKKDFIKTIDKRFFYLDSALRAKLNEKVSQENKKEYLSFIFSYYENILHSLDRELIKNTPELIDETIEEAWYYLRLINSDVLKHLEWLNYYVSRFFMYAAWEAFIERYLQILPKVQKDTKKEYLVTLYNNLAGLYESIGEAKLARKYYDKVVKLNRPQKLLA